MRLFNLGVFTGVALLLASFSIPINGADSAPGVAWCDAVCLIISICSCCCQLRPKVDICKQACCNKGKFITLAPNVLSGREEVALVSLGESAPGKVFIIKKLACCSACCCLHAYYEGEDAVEARRECSCGIFLCDIGPSEPAISRKCASCAERIMTLPTGKKIALCCLFTCLAASFCCCNLELECDLDMALIPISNCPVMSESLCSLCGKNAARCLVVKLEPWMENSGTYQVPAQQSMEIPVPIPMVISTRPKDD